MNSEPDFEIGCTVEENLRRRLRLIREEPQEASTRAAEEEVRSRLDRLLDTKARHALARIAPDDIEFACRLLDVADAASLSRGSRDLVSIGRRARELADDLERIGFHPDTVRDFERRVRSGEEIAEAFSSVLDAPGVLRDAASYLDPVIRNWRSCLRVRTPETESEPPDRKEIDRIAKSLEGKAERELEEHRPRLHREKAALTTARVRLLDHVRKKTGEPHHREVAILDLAARGRSVECRCDAFRSCTVSGCAVAATIDALKQAEKRS